MPPILNMHIHNGAKDNKCRFFYTIFFIIIGGIGHFQEGLCVIYDVGHTHLDIDACFECWSMKLHERDFPFVPLLTKSYMALDIIPVILHLVEEIPDFKAFIELYNVDGKNRLVEYTKSQSLWFYMGDGDLLAM